MNTSDLANSLPRRCTSTTRSYTLVLISAAFILVTTLPAFAQTAVRFTAEIPQAPAGMQIYKLAPTAAPLPFLNEKLTAVKLPTLQLEQKTYIARMANVQNERDAVRAYSDPVSGDTHFIPNMAELAFAKVATVLPPERLQSIARSALTDVRFIPKDVTEVRIADLITVMGGATATGAATTAAPVRTDPKTVLTIAPAVRYAGGFQVYGRGSRALVSLANDGSIVGALRRWRTASLGDRVQTAITPDQVRGQIQRQLAPQLKSVGTQVTVDKVEVAYYDGNANYLQPVYYFQATVKSPAKEVSDIKIAGFVPIGKVLEPIPDLAAPATNGPAVPQQIAKGAIVEKPILAQSATGGAGGATAISLGEYPNQDWRNDGGYVDMSTNFLAGLNAGNAFARIFGNPQITRTQWYVAYPWEVVGTQSKNFMNAVNIAYTVPHGDWLLNTTLRNCCQEWQVPNIGTGGNPGFGAAAGGKLATWVIMSCEVIPSMYDRQNETGGTGNPYTAFNAWFPVFQGLHNAIGFRTIMFYPDDGLQFGFGYDAALGGDINAAWFHEVAAYDGNDGTYVDQHLKNNTVVHYDRASTMIDARNLGQSIYNVGAQSASTTLWNFWMNN